MFLGLAVNFLKTLLHHALCTAAYILFTSLTIAISQEVSLSLPLSIDDFLQRSVHIGKKRIHIQPN
jgi:hypothetical protein